MEEESDWKKLPLEERCAHKLWKARVDGFEEVTNIFRQIDDEKSKEWLKYLGMIKKMVTDSNALAQEKGLEAALAFIENSNYAGKTIEDVMSGIVTKCIAAPKTKTKELSLQVTLMYVEIEKQDLVIEELLKGTEHINPKINAACVNAISMALKEFGGKNFNLKVILKRMPVLLVNKDKSVRDESKALMVELYRCVGAVAKSQMSTLPAILVTELEVEFEKIKNERVAPTRFLRSQQQKQACVAAEGGQNEEVNGGDDEADAGPEIDPFDLLDPVDILSQIPKDFYDKLESKKWQERKESLDALETLLKSQKLEPGDYGDVVRVLRHVIAKDTNVMLVALAGKCLASLATGLKKGFNIYALSCVSIVLEKFKEKKPNVVSSFRDAIDAIYLCTNIEAINEDCIAYLGNKNPSIRAETGSFLSRAFARTLPTALNKKLLKSYTAALLKNLNDSDPVVREAAADALGTAMKLVGEKNILPFLVDLDNLKTTKIKECCEKAVILVKIPAVKKARPVTAPENKEPPPPKARIVKPGTAKRPTTGIKKAIAKPVARKQSPDEDEDYSQGDDNPIQSVSREGSIDISGLITEALINEMADKNWNTRNEALSKVQGIIGNGNIKSNIGELTHALAARLVDSNSKIAQNTIAICQTLATAMGPSCKVHVRTLFPGFLHGLGDSKTWIRAAAIVCINVWGDQCGFKEFFDGEMIFDSLKAGSPTLRTELWAWLGEKLPTITVKTIPKDELLICLPILYTNLEDRNAEVRKTANEAVLGFMWHLNYDSMYKNTDKLKPASAVVVKAALEKARPNLPMKLLMKKQASSDDIDLRGRGVRVAGPKGKMVAAKGGKSVNRGGKKDVEIDNSPLLCINNQKHQRMIDEQKLRVLKWNFTTPREEFIDLLRDQMTAAGVSKALMFNMFHSDFRYHVKALESLTDIAGENIDATSSNLDLILKWLTLRFFDTNPTVLLKGLEYLQTVFQILIEQGYTMAENEASSFLPYLIVKVGDPKEPIRIGVRALFRQICHMYSVNKLFSFVMDGLKSKNARQRQECLDELGVLIASYGIGVCQPSLLGALKEIVKQISDRDNSVRNAALNAIVQTYHIQGEKMSKVLAQLQLNEKDQSLLDERIRRASKNRPAAPSSATIVKTSKPLPVIEPDADEDREEEIVVEEFDNQENIQPAMITAQSPMRGNGYGGILASRPKPVTGPYNLDPDFIAKIENFAVSIPKDIPHNIDLGFLNEPVPPVRVPTNLGMPPANIDHNPTKFQVASNRPSPTGANIDHLISLVGSHDLNTALVAMKDMEQILSSSKANQMTEYEDMFMMAVVQQFRNLNGYSAANYGEISRGLRALFTVLTEFYEQKVVGRRVSVPVLYQLMEQILSLLVDNRLKNYEDESGSYHRVINSLCFKILDRSDHSNITLALLKLMHSCFATSQSPRHSELVMKCLWKVIKSWPDFIDDINHELVLLEINFFYQSYPSTFWKKRPNDTPFKTIKTLLHTMLKYRGPQMLVITTKLADSLEPELQAYMTKLQKSICPNGVDSMPPPRETSREKDHHRRMSRSNHEQLSKIFQQIGNKEHTKEGLSQLYEFREANPDVDICPFLKDASDFFKQYIESGLLNIESERGVRKKMPKLSGGDATTIRKLAQETLHPRHQQQVQQDPVVKDPTYYMNRLKELHINTQAAASGNVLDNRAADENLNVMLGFQDRIATEYQSQHAEPTEDQNQDSTVAQLRQKLERIRNTK